MMGVAAPSGKCRILITMRFKVQQKGEHQGTKNSTTASQAQGRRASQKRSEFYFTEIITFLKMLFSLDGNNMGCPFMVASPAETVIIVLNRRACRPSLAANGP